jgi:hypothetical protein
MNKTKKQRQEWWYSLTPEQQNEYITKRQAQTELRRSKKDRTIDPKRAKKYPWLIDGVNKENRTQWVNMVLSKNPWLRPSLFEN